MDWHKSIITYLKVTLNISKNVPIYYVIIPNEAPHNPSEEEKIVLHAPLVGAGYKLDNQKVHQFLTELTSSTDASQWIKDYRRNQDGRGAWQNLCSHYDGNTEGDKCVTVARHDIKIMAYKNEPSFSFEKYSTHLKKVFSTLEAYKQPKV